MGVPVQEAGHQCGRRIRGQELHFLEQLHLPLPELGGGQRAVRPTGFSQLPATGVHGIQGTGGFLKHHPHGPPSILGPGAGGEGA
jgi:hypothetical protein